MLGWLDGQGWDSPLTGPSVAQGNNNKHSTAKRNNHPSSDFSDFLGALPHGNTSAFVFLSLSVFCMAFRRKKTILWLFHPIYLPLLCNRSWRNWRNWSYTTFSVVLIWYPSSICIYQNVVLVIYQCRFGHTVGLHVYAYILTSIYININVYTFKVKACKKRYRYTNT